MENAPKQMFSSSDDDRLMEPRRKENSLALVSLAFGVLAVFVVLAGSDVNNSLGHKYIPEMQYPRGESRATSDQMSNLFTFFEQSIVFLVTNTVTLVLSLVSFALGIFTLDSRQKTPAILGILFSAIAILLIFR